MISNTAIILFGTLSPTAIFLLITQTPVAASLFPLLGNKSTTRLRFTNLHLEGLRFWLLFTYFVLGTIKRRLGLSNALNLVVKDGAKASDPQAQRVYKGDRIALNMPFAITPLEFRAYAASIGTDQTLDDLLQVPAHLQLFLAALTAPAMVLLLAKSNCPVDPIGSVNVRNRFEIPEVARCAEVLMDEMLHPKDKLVLYASLDKEVAVVKRGYEFRIVVELREGSDLLFRQYFTTLQFAKHGLKVESKASTESPTAPVVGTCKILATDPAKWAFISRDYNPIHLYTIPAKLMGFSKRIAHGNHVAAKVVEAVQQGEDGGATGAKEQWLEVEFKRPTFVPDELEIRKVGAGKGETVLDICSSGKVNATVKYSS